MPNFEKTQSFTLSYQMDFDNLVSLEKIINEIVKSDKETIISYKVDLRNGEIINKLSLKELTELPNSGSSTIIAITASTPYNYDSTSTIIIMFSNNLKNSIEYILTTDNIKDFDYYQKELKSYIKNLETLYSKITKSFMVVTVAIAILVGVFIYQISVYITPFILDSPSVLLKVILISMWFILTTIISIIIGKIIKFTFPIGEFKIGAGIRIAEHRAWFRNAVLFSLLLPLLIPFLIPIFFSLINYMSKANF